MNVEALTQRQIEKIIEAAEDDIAELRQKYPTVKMRIEKNQIDARITGRQNIIRKLKTMQHDVRATEQAL